MATNGRLQAYEALGKLDDQIIRARGLVANDVDSLQVQLLEAQLQCIEALRSRGLTARAALELVIMATYAPPVKP